MTVCVLDLFASERLREVVTAHLNQTDFSISNFVKIKIKNQNLKESNEEEKEKNKVPKYLRLAGAENESKARIPLVLRMSVVATEPQISTTAVEVENSRAAIAACNLLHCN
mgnify:CR=1 FL=1